MREHKTDGSECWCEPRRLDPETMKEAAAASAAEKRARMIDEALMYGVPDVDAFWREANDLIPEIIRQDIIKRLDDATT